MNTLKALLLVAMAFVVTPAYAGEFTFIVGNKDGKHKPMKLADSFEKAMKCVVKKIQEDHKYFAKDIGCFGTRPHNPSAHPTGHACDIDQTARDKTLLNSRIMRADQINLAKDCEAVSGCQWRNPDCGHYEQKSAPYSPSGTGIHHYAGYERHQYSR
jgi:hypothetical protein